MSLSPAFQGVRTLEQLKLRCRVQEDTGCWVWALAYTSSRGGDVPVVYMPKYGKTMSAMRAAVLLSRGVEPSAIAGRRAWARCQTPGCVNPAHLSCGTHLQFNQFIVTTGRRKDLPQRRIANAKIMRARSELTEADVQAIRAAQGTLDQIAAQFGNRVSRTQIHRIRQGKSWQPMVPGASVFDLGRRV